MKYTGGCHCGAVRFEAEVETESVMECNCSYCAKVGHLLAFTGASNFRLLHGEDNLTDYQFNHKVIHHLFCKTCGIHSFGRAKNPDGSDGVAVNMRCVDDVDLAAFRIDYFDGKSL